MLFTFAFGCIELTQYLKYRNTFLHWLYLVKCCNQTESSLVLENRSFHSKKDYEKKSILKLNWESVIKAYKVEPKVRFIFTVMSFSMRNI